MKGCIVKELILENNKDYAFIYVVFLGHILNSKLFLL